LNEMSFPRQSSPSLPLFFWLKDGMRRLPGLYWLTCFRRGRRIALFPLIFFFFGQQPCAEYIFLLFLARFPRRLLFFLLFPRFPFLFFLKATVFEPLPPLSFLLLREIFECSQTPFSYTTLLPPLSRKGRRELSLPCLHSREAAGPDGVPPLPKFLFLFLSEFERMEVLLRL